MALVSSIPYACLMWRVLVVGLLSACGDDSAHHAPTDAAIDATVVYETSPFTMLLCTAGNPGDPTCPFNQIPLDALGATAAGARLRFVAAAAGEGLEVRALRMDAPHSLHLEDLSFAHAGTDGVLIVESLDNGITATALVDPFDPIGPIAIHVAVVY